MTSKGKRVLIVVTSHDKLGESGEKTGWYLPEVAHPYYVFENAKYTIDFVSPKGGKAPLDPGSEKLYEKDPECQKFKSEVIKKLDNTMKPSDVDPKNYNVIFYAGGHGPMFDLADNKEIADICTKIYEAGGVVAAVCHGTVGLLPVKYKDDFLIKGKKVTSFTNDEENAVKLMKFMPFPLETKLKEKGAKFVSVKDFDPLVEVCDRIMTGQNPASAKPLTEAIVQHLGKK